jgi:hypothetical protein
LVLVWKDARAFRRHLEVMRNFRQSHSIFPLNGQMFGGIPTPYDADFSWKGNRITYHTDSKGRAILAPLWKVEVPPGSQN